MNGEPTIVRFRPPLLAAYLAFAFVVGLLGSRSLDPRTFEFDLVPFYCGGVAVADGANPYRVEPLRSCEHAESAAFAFAPAFVVPDPLPAYDQAVFSVVSRVPFRVVRAVWPGFEVAAFLITALLLAAICDVPAVTVASVLLVSDLWCSGLLGQLEPFAILGLVLAAWGLERTRPWPVCIGLALAMSEPQLGLPASIAVLFFGDRAARWAVLGAAAMLGLLSLRLPLDTGIEYVSRVLPAHALSEANNQDQYGMVYAFHRLGFSGEAAARAASALFVAILVASVLLARAAARRFGAAALPFVATTVASLGLPFAHLPHMAAALPAAVFVATKTRSRYAGAAVALLSVPWLDFANTLRFLPVAALGQYVALRRFCGARPLASAVAVVLATVVIIAATREATLHAVGDIIRFPSVRAIDLPEESWKAVVDAQQHRYRGLADLAKLPTAIGLVALVVSIVRATLFSPAPAPRVTKSS